MTNRLEDARRKLESETRLTEALADARRIEAQRAQAAAQALADVAAQRAELAARSRRRKRWLPAMALAAMLAVGAVFHAAVPGAGAQGPSQQTDWAALEQRVADLRAQTADMPELVLPEPREAEQADVEAEEPDPEPTSQPTRPPVDEPDQGVDAEDVDAEDLEDGDDDGRIVLDCDIDSPLGCMDE